MTVHRCSSYEYEEMGSCAVWERSPLSGFKGKHVFIKPNLVTPPSPWDVQSVTDYRLLNILLGRLSDAGVKSVIVGCCGFKGQWAKTIKLSRYDKICARHGAQLVCVQEGENFHAYTLLRFPNKEDYLSLYGTKVSDFFLRAEVRINLPKLKIHSLCTMTCAIKNLMGVISPKGAMHPNGSIPILHKRLRDLYALLSPMIDWTLVDGIIGAEYAEQYGVPKKAGVLISGEDMFQVDCEAADVIGMGPEQVWYLHHIHRKDKKPWPDRVSLGLRTVFEGPLSRRAR